MSYSSMDEWSKEDRFLAVTFYTIGAGVIFAMLCMLGYVVRDHYKTKPFNATPASERTVHTETLGTITKVSDCYRGKYRFSCYITTSNGNTFETDFGDWPGGYLAVGDQLSIQYVTAAKNQYVSYCLHGRCYQQFHYFSDSKYYKAKYE